MEREIWEIVKALDEKKLTAIEAHKKLCDLLSDVSARLSSSLGEVDGNAYEIFFDKDGRFWINHKEVGSGEPLKQWIDGVLNDRQRTGVWQVSHALNFELKYKLDWLICCTHC